MGETYKESICRAFPKEAVASKADSDLFLMAIQNHFCRELSDRLMEILKSNGEVAVKLSDIRAFDEHYLNEIHYVQQFKWTPLIRCKDCKHYRPMIFAQEQKGELNDYLRISGDR